MSQSQVSEWDINFPFALALGEHGKGKKVRVVSAYNKATGRRRKRNVFRRAYGAKKGRHKEISTRLKIGNEIKGKKGC